MMKLIEEFKKKMKREGLFWKVKQNSKRMDNCQLKNQDQEKFKIV